LQQNLSVVEVSGLELEFVGLSNSAALEVALPQTKTFKIERGQKGSNYFWFVRDIDKRTLQVIGNSVLRINGKNLQIQGKPVPQNILLSAKQNRIDVIGAVELDSYVAGVVAREMPLTWPLQALKAQAIATRSYTLATARARRKQLVQLESSILDQVFTHLTQKDSGQEKYQHVFQAVRETSGEILIDQQGRVLKAFYHSECGGKTSSSAAAFGVAGLKGGAVDASCPLHKGSGWSYSLSKTDLLASLGLTQMGDLTDVQPVLEKETDHVAELRLRFQNQKIFKISAQKLRQALGFDKVKSTVFQVSSQSETVSFDGHGRGHGVGLCQWGTRSLAEKGRSYQQILGHYYPEARLDSRKNFQSKKANGQDDQSLYR
jgi:stage II sporulation protein D